MASTFFDLHIVSATDMGNQDALKAKIESSLMRMKGLLPFESLVSMQNFFKLADFRTSVDLHTFYGTIKLCPVSNKLLKLFLKDNCSLQRLSALHLSQRRNLSNEINELLRFRDIFVPLVLTVSSCCHYLHPLEFLCFLGSHGPCRLFETSRCP